MLRAGLRGELRHPRQSGIGMGRNKKPEIKYPRLIVSVKRHEQLARLAKAASKAGGRRVTIATVVEEALASSLDK